jgi:hypothetical protein
MRSTITWLLIATLGAGLAGCGRAYDGEQRFPVSGKVTVDGQPLDLGVIAFMPQGEGKSAGRVAGAPIRDGLYAVPEETGPTAATYKVQIHWNKRTGKKIPNPMDTDELMDELTEGLPAKYHEKSELTAEVSAQRTTFDYDLKTD